MRGQYYTCPICKANLDFGEKCDCQSENEKRDEYYQRYIKIMPKTGQLTFNFDNEEVGNADETNY